MPFDSIPDIIDDIRAGRMVVILDDEDRENEGDLIMAAEKVRAEDINFMAREGRGLICLALTGQRCAQLKLPPMVSHNTSTHRTNFTVSIEAAEGVTTGISAQDRARTVHAAVRRDARPEDLHQPGHIFPLEAQPGGVLSRAGHTEAASDLARLAGLEPAAVLVEVLQDDGSMARRPELEAFARRHGLKIGTVAELIRYRLETEQTVERVHQASLDNEFGRWQLVVYRDLLRSGIHAALVRGVIDDGEPVLTRVHACNLLEDVLHAVGDGGSFGAREAMRRIAKSDHGVLVVLTGEDDPDALLSRLRGETPLAASVDDRAWRQLGLGAQILADLGARKLRVLGTSRKLVGLAGFGLDVVEYLD